MNFCAGARLTKLTFLLLVPAILPLKDASSAALEFSAELGGRYESNASNSNLASDRLADGFFTAHLKLAPVACGVAIGAGMLISRGKVNRPFDSPG